jgi:hypothetical protein
MEQIVIDRIAEILIVCKDFIDDWKHWRDEKSGRQLTTDARFWEHWERCINTYRGGMRPSEIGGVCDVILAIQDEVQRLELDIEGAGEPGDNMWSMVTALDERIRDFLNPIPPSRVPTPKELRKMPHMGEAQVALMYGFKRNNDGDIAALHEAERDPDFPGNYENPLQLEYQQKMDMAQTIVASMERQRPKSRSERARKSEKSSRESGKSSLDPKELFDLGLSVPQAAKLLKTSEPRVADMFSRFARDRQGESPQVEDVAGPLGDLPDPARQKMVEEIEEVVRSVDVKVFLKMCEKAGVEPPNNYRKSTIIPVLEKAGYDWKSSLMDAIA